MTPHMTRTGPASATRAYSFQRLPSSLTRRFFGAAFAVAFALVGGEVDTVVVYRQCRLISRLSSVAGRQSQSPVGSLQSPVGSQQSSVSVVSRPETPA